MRTHYVSPIANILILSLEKKQEIQKYQDKYKLIYIKSIEKNQ